MTVGQFLGVWGALTVVALATSIASLWLHFKSGSLHELTSQVRATSGDMAELFDLFEKWTRRDRVRRLREGREEATVPAAPDPNDKKAYKNFLRQKAMGKVQ